MDLTVIITIMFLIILILTATLVTLYTESRKRTKRLEERIERLSNRLQAMNMKELDTVLKSVQHKKERDELYKLIDDMYSTSEALEDGRQIKLLPRYYLDKSNRVFICKREDGKTKYTAYYTYNPSHDTPSQSNTQTDSTSSQDSTSPKDSSSYLGGGGDFSGGGSGGSWD